MSTEGGVEQQLCICVRLHNVAIFTREVLLTCAQTSVDLPSITPGHCPPVTSAGRKPFANAADVSLSPEPFLYEDMRELKLLSIYC
jgi:hypothetical protein